MEHTLVAIYRADLNPNKGLNPYFRGTYSCRSRNDRVPRRKSKVLILIFVEHTLVALHSGLLSRKTEVLILIFVEHTLVGRIRRCYIPTIWNCLNPYFRGTYSCSCRKLHNSRAYSVLILIFVEHTLVAHAKVLCQKKDGS